MPNFTQTDLINAFNDFKNRHAILSDLKMIPLKVSNRRARYTAGHFNWRSKRVNKSIQLHITVNSTISSSQGIGGWKQTLLHEMVHYYLFEKYCRQTLVDLMNNPMSGYHMAKYKQGAQKSNHTPEFHMILNDLVRKEKAGISTTPAPVKKTPVERPTAPKTGTGMGDMIETFCGMGKIIGVTATYYTVKLNSGNTARVRI